MAAWGGPLLCPVSMRFAVARLLVTGSVVSAATALRVGASWAELWTRRTAPLVGLAVKASTTDTNGASAAALRDELLALLRDSAEASWRELRRGVDDFDSFTRHDDEQPRPRRPYRVKP